MTNDMNINDLVNGCMDAIKNKTKNLKTLNIMIIGKTGVGKSTLVNEVFRDNIAATGIGSPVTQHMQKCTKKDVPLVIYDTKGFELERKVQQEIKNELIEKIKEGRKSRDINQAIHCIWYCVNACDDRFEPSEEQWIREFTKQNEEYQIPVIIILTKAYFKDSAQALKKEIEARNLDVIKVLPVLAQDKENYKAYGLDTLIEVMEQSLPDEMVDTLMSIQISNLALKQKKSQAAVVAAAMSAAAAGAIPIPFSDAAVLIPIEAGMLTSITVIFGFEISKSVLTGLVSTVVGTGGTTMAGRALVTNLLKMIPGLGTLAGGVISGTTAALLTTALGEAYIALMTAMFNGEINVRDLETEKGQDKLNKLFKKELEKKRS